MMGPLVMSPRRDIGDDSSYTIDTTGMSGLAVFAQHVPIEFERDQHYLKDSSGTDIEPWLLKRVQVRTSS